MIAISLLIFLFSACLFPAFGKANAESSTDARLTFGADGTFTVLILSDLQDTQYTTQLVQDGSAGVIRDYPADLIVLLGDQLEGASPVLRFGNGEKNCANTIQTLLAPVLESGVPFAVVFGNHDYEAPISIRQQAKLYESYDNCVGVSFGINSSEDGAFALPVYEHDSDIPKMTLYFFDSGSYLANGDYDTVSKEQVAWYNEQSAAFRSANDNQALPSVAFCHIALPEVYGLFTEVEKGTKDAFKGVGSGAGRYYLPDYDRIFTGDVNESPCPSSENNGLFEAYLENGDVFLTVNGHDHINSFIGNLDGIDIASAPGSSYTSYGSEDVRGVRLFRFTEHCVKDYETLHVRYSDYNSPARFGFLRYYFSTTTGIYNAVKVFVVLLLFVAALIVLIVLVVRKKKRPPCEEALPGSNDEFDDDPVKPDQKGE
ncbi:MAG: metallophosphoesterase [Eubacteriales bacterium]|nr:metallophosphoesterase [Eubacteriales bacterium]